MKKYGNSLKHYRDTKNMIDTLLGEGLAKGIEKARAAGYAGDYVEGYAEGYAEGRQEALLEVTRRCLAINYPVDEIVRLTGLSAAEIEALR